MKSVYGDECVEVLWTRRYRAGYVLRKERIRHHNEEVCLTVAYTPSGKYIGDSKMAHYLCAKRGIKPTTIRDTSRTCSIGYCEKEKKWYGWSHRAIYGFKIGDVVKKGDCCASSGFTAEHLKKHPEADLSLPVGFTAKSEEDCRRMAVAFADSVS